MRRSTPCNPHRSSGVALVIVLAFVVLLTGLAVAFFSRAACTRQVASSSFQEARADELARSALEITTSSLKQEIVNGSNPSTSGSCTLYLATDSAYLLPQRNGTWPAIPNLVRISSGTAASWPAADAVPASQASTTATSANGRNVTPARWNRSYLIPRAAPSSVAIDSTPVAGFIPPSWIFVTSQGPVLLASPTSSVMGRYAYAIYDESGLLDVNVAGYPSNSTPAQYGTKGPLAFADLTALQLPAQNLPSSQIDNLVGWRHSATAQASGTFANIHFDGAGAQAFCDAMLSNTNGFLKVSGTAAADGRTDQAFLTRQELIELQRSLGFTQNALPYLGTFSRALTAPSQFNATRFTTGGTLVHYHDDGTRSESAVSAGDPLLQSRFSLGKLGWITPSGTPPGSVTAAAIQACFGLKWNAANTTGTARWDYVGPAGTPLYRIETLAEIAGESEPREPNFFELLKAGIAAASLGGDDSGIFRGQPDFQIIQIGANLIDQSDGDNAPTSIYLGFDPEKSEQIQTASGVENLDNTPGGIILNRHLRSAGELGYVFRDASFQTLDFSSAQSADSALLDLFSAMDEPPLAAGKLNPNQAAAPVLQAVLAGTFLDGPSGATLSSANAGTAASQLAVQFSASPLRDASGLVSALAAASPSLSCFANKTEREAVIRALAPVSNPRTWNLMIDVIAQTGVFPPAAASLDHFTVQSERRYWLHVAIDRLTGKIVDEQLEAVYE